MVIDPAAKGAYAKGFRADCYRDRHQALIQAITYGEVSNDAEFLQVVM
jgi:hypothetical protein